MVNKKCDDLLKFLGQIRTRLPVSSVFFLLGYATQEPILQYTTGQYLYPFQPK